ncbi:MAG TPA: hypothetical protein VLE22_12130 [Bryobacteraceae bacterium]|nr:hypothetical protein [Bryobacteraceae bacterium]
MVILRLAGWRVAAAVFWIAVASPAAPRPDSDPVLHPGPEQVPEWAQQGKYRFARLDGGPIEILKTARSSWGMHFTAREKEILGNLYSTYRDRMIDLLGQANLNWVWITWSVGYSWEDEARQRDECRTLTSKLHEKGIRVAAYLCAASMFWESMFRDEPRSTRWLRFDPQGVPFRYSSGRDPLRFVADVSNPEWVEYQKRRIGAAIDAGVDAFFLDNTSQTGWSDNETMDRYIGRLRRYIREEKRSPAVLLTNYGLASNRIVLNRNMEVVFNEYWVEPGVFGQEWNATNVRRMKYVRGVVPEWKPLISEYSRFHEGDRAHGWLKPKSAQLGIAEAAAFGSAYAWDMEGPFDAALVDGDAGALETWRAIGRYNGFLKDNENLYWKARGAAPVAVLISERRRRNVIQFGWDKDETGLYDLLASNSVLHDIRLVDALEGKQLAAYAGVVVPPFVESSARLTDVLKRFRTNGGKVVTLSETLIESLETNESARREVLEKVRGLAPARIGLAVEGVPHVLGNITRLGSRRALAVHLLNYAPEAASGVRVRVNLGREFALLAGAQPRLLTPDLQTEGLVTARSGASTVEFQIQNLDTYGVIVIE